MNQTIFFSSGFNQLLKPSSKKAASGNRTGGKTHRYTMCLIVAPNPGRPLFLPYHFPSVPWLIHQVLHPFLIFFFFSPIPVFYSLELNALKTELIISLFKPAHLLFTLSSLLVTS